MQSELIAMQHQKTEIEKSLSHRKNIAHSPSRSTSKNRNYKSPTFWTTNPITHDQKYSPHQPRTPSPNRKEYQTVMDKRLMPNLQNIGATVDQSYYHPNGRRDSKERSPSSPKAHIFQGKRFEFSEFGTTGYFDRYKESKKKTYERKRQNPILDPEQEKTKTGIKITRTPSKSPDNILTEHPNSNPQLYNFLEKTTIVPRKGAIRDKNQSSLTLCSSLGELVPIKFDENTSPVRKKSQRKHFARYFKDNFCSQFEFE